MLSVRRPPGLSPYTSRPFAPALTPPALRGSFPAPGNSPAPDTPTAEQEGREHLAPAPEIVKKSGAFEQGKR